VLVQATVIDAAGATAVTDRVGGLRVVDTTAPRVAMAVLPVATTAASMRWSWQGVDAGSGVRSYDVRYQRASYSGGFGAWTTRRGWTATTATAKSLPLAAGFDYCVEVRARDTVGNVGPWSARRCVARALDDRALVAATGAWTRHTGAGFYFGTYTTTSRAAQSLTRTGARLVRVGVVATTCARCGTVAVYVGGRRVGRLSLYSPAPARRQVLLLPRFGYRAGTVRLTTVTTGKTVQIDGLVISRT
jgi:hypothetical protein